MIVVYPLKRDGRAGYLETVNSEKLARFSMPPV